MKTETEISKRVVEELNKARKNADGDLIVVLERNMKIHEATCQRWLDFLEKIIKYIEILKPIQDSIAYEQIHNKTQDLKTAIKLYEEEGI